MKQNNFSWPPLRKSWIFRDAEETMRTFNRKLFLFGRDHQHWILWCSWVCSFRLKTKKTAGFSPVSSTQAFDYNYNQLIFIIDTWYIIFYDILINVADKRFQKKKYITTIRLHTHKNVSASLWNKKQKLGQNSSSLLKWRAIKWKKCDRQHCPDLRVIFSVGITIRSNVSF